MSTLITGGTGSLGYELTKKLLARHRYHDDKIVIFSRDEQKQEAMASYFGHDPRLRFFIGDVRDQPRLGLALRGIKHIIHAAALKIVPALEYNPMEAVKTNVLGTQNLIEAIVARNVPCKVVALSTDKAVSPVNLYGATKLTLEKLVVAANNIDPQFYQFSAVRYGNVACSRGSVIPKFKQAAKEGKPLEVTHEAMTRFWITLSEAADFVLDRLNDAQGGEVFIPDMRSFRIVDAADLIKGNSSVTYVGVRPGEKIHETIISQDEYANGYYDKRRKCYVVNPKDVESDKERWEPLTGALTSANFKMNPDQLTACLYNVGALSAWKKTA